MNISDAWAKSLQDVIQTSVMIEGTLRPVILMSCAAAAREIDLDESEIIHDYSVSSLVRKGYSEAKRRRSSTIRLRLRQERGRPPERVLVIMSAAAPLRERHARKASSRTDVVAPTPAQDAEVIGPRTHFAELLAQVASLIQKVIEQARKISRLEAEHDADHDRIEVLARMVEALRQHFRAENGDPPTAPGLPSI